MSDRRMGVIQGNQRNEVRHICWGPLRDPMPLCTGRHTRAWGWQASSARSTHELPVCSRCMDRFAVIARSVDNDNGVVEFRRGE
jgi:hypothetical protein